MKILRSVLGVIVGYAIFVVSALMLFQLFHIDPHAEPSFGILVFVLLWGQAFSFLGGFLAQGISGTRSLMVNYVLAGIMAGFAAFSLFKSAGNHYTQVGAILLFAPMSVVGGLVKIRRGKTV